MMPRFAQGCSTGRASVTLAARASRQLMVARFPGLDENRRQLVARSRMFSPPARRHVALSSMPPNGVVWLNDGRTAMWAAASCAPREISSASIYRSRTSWQATRACRTRKARRSPPPVKRRQAAALRAPARNQLLSPRLSRRRRTLTRRRVHRLLRPRRASRRLRLRNRRAGESRRQPLDPHRYVPRPARASSPPRPESPGGMEVEEAADDQKLPWLDHPGVSCCSEPCRAG